MSETYKDKVAGHALLGLGLPFPACSCGTYPPRDCNTHYAIRTWHRQHKADVIATLAKVRGEAQ